MREWTKSEGIADAFLTYWKHAKPVDPINAALVHRAHRTAFYSGVVWVVGQLLESKTEVDVVEFLEGLQRDCKQYIVERIRASQQ